MLRSQMLHPYIVYVEGGDHCFDADSVAARIKGKRAHF